MSKNKGGIRNIRPENPSLEGLQNDPRYYDRETERAYVFNSDGSLNMTISQHVNVSVAIPPEVLDTMEGKILIHNHPIEALSTYPRSGLSVGDVYLTAKYNLSEIRATNVMGTHILRRGKNGWPSMNIVEKAINNSRVDYGKIANGSWVRDFARKTGGKYAFIPR